jgi:hypothetical protein
MAGTLNVDTLKADSNLKLQIASANVAFIDANGLTIVGNSLNVGGGRIVVTSNNSISTPSVIGANLVTATGTTALGITANGQITTANAPFILTGGQLQFPATQIPSGDGNCLDDYEEGTWTPTIQGDAGATGQAYSTQDGTYTKIGRQVTLMFTCVLSTKGTLSGTYVQIKGFPFTVAALPNLTGGSPIYFTNLAENWIYLSLQTQAGATAAYVWGQTTATTSRTYIGFSAVGNTTQFNCCLTYFV